VPVESVRGRYGGYRLAPGYRMPPLMLTDDEAVAVLLGLIGTRRATLQPDTAVAVESATAKVHRVLPRALEPYGVVAHRGRWYATGLDSRSGQVRSFRLDRVAHAVVQEGQFSVPGGFDPAAQVVPSVLAGLDRPFAIEEPDELRERVRALAEQLASWAEAR